MQDAVLHLCFLVVPLRKASLLDYSSLVQDMAVILVMMAVVIVVVVVLVVLVVVVVLVVAVVVGVVTVVVVAHIFCFTVAVPLTQYQTTTLATKTQQLATKISTTTQQQPTTNNQQPTTTTINNSNQQLTYSVSRSVFFSFSFQQLWCCCWLLIIFQRSALRLTE